MLRTAIVREIGEEHTARFQQLHLESEPFHPSEHKLNGTFSHENDAVPVMVEHDDTEALAAL